VLGGLASHKVVDVRRLRSAPYMAMEVDEAALLKLGADPYVINIEEDVPLPPTLAESIRLINANGAWAGGSTGAGQVIAVLDIWVDSNHVLLQGKVVSEVCFSSTSAASGSTTLCPDGSGEQRSMGPG
jgi:subtilisin